MDRWINERDRKGSQIHSSLNNFVAFWLCQKHNEETKIRRDEKTGFVQNSDWFCSAVEIRS